MNRKSKTLLGIASLCWAGWSAPGVHANVALDWSALMMTGIRSDTTGPTLASRNLAILHLAIYDAVNSVTGTYQPYLTQLSPPPATSAEAAAAGAGRTVLKVLYPSLSARTDGAFELWLATTANDAAITNGLTLGTTVAERLLAARANDGSATDVPYIPSDKPGQWRRTPPFFRPPLTPQWRYVTPFALPELGSFVPGPPPALNSAAYAEAFNEVKQIGAKNSTVRTAEQSQIATFWSDFSYTAMPPGHWHEIAATIANSKGTSLRDTARLMALLSLAQADGAIVCWETKFKYNLWRPVTAIQRAGEDENAVTEADPTWDHLLASPPFPAYPSGHSVFSKASSEVLTSFYGTDAISFTTASDSLPGVFRNFKSLAACADEVGMSRIYGGIHFQFDNVDGKRSGEKIAQYVLGNWLLPNSQLPAERLVNTPPETLSLRLHGRTGTTLVLESSTDLHHWKSVATNAAVAGGVAWPAPTAGATQQFLRLREVP